MLVGGGIAARRLISANSKPVASGAPVGRAWLPFAEGKVLLARGRFAKAGCDRQTKTLIR
jgi:hypothetical protein